MRLLLLAFGRGAVDSLDLATGGFDRGLGTGRRKQSAQHELLADLALFDDLGLLRTGRDQLGGAQRGEIDGAGVQLVQLVQQHFGDVERTLGAETDLRQAPLHRHLAAFEASLDLALAAARKRTLVAATSGLAEARTDAATDALALLAGAIGGLECVEFHSITPRPGPGSGPC